MTTPVSSEEIDRLAQWLHDEVDYPDPDFPGCSWPDHDDDTGARGNGGYVRLVPRDVVSQFRNIAARALARFPSLTAPASAASFKTKDGAND